MWSKNVSFENGELHLSGISATTLAREFGTPAFFFDEADFRARALAWKDELAKQCGAHSGTMYYAAKSFISVAVARVIAELEFGIDVCTGGELAVALAGGIKPTHIEMHGNNKSVAEIERAVSLGIKTIVVDSLDEIARVAASAQSQGKVQNVMIRLIPGIKADTHAKISTAHEDVKFGFSIQSGAAATAVATIMGYPQLSLRGVHCHIGSQIFGAQSHESAIAKLVEFLGWYRDTYNAQLPELNVGGGFGIAYLDGEKTVEPNQVLPAIYRAVAEACAKNQLEIPLISIEPGRNIIGPTMFTLYEVGTVKKVDLGDGTTRTYISVDGGMSDNIRPSLYDAQYSAVLAQRKSSAPLQLSRLVGKHCETGDIIINDLQLPSDIAPGDLIATPATGAYGRSMASNYNHVPRPPVIAVIHGKARVIVRRENEADLLALDVKE
jgi:diaminopimelate decarboxylase